MSIHVHIYRTQCTMTLIQCVQYSKDRLGVETISALLQTHCPLLGRSTWPQPRFWFMVWFSFELVHLKVDISSSIDIFFYVCKAKVYTEFCAQVHRDRDGRMRILFALYYFTKACFFCYCECTQLKVESLQIWKMYYYYLYEQKLRSILRASGR